MTKCPLISYGKQYAQDAFEIDCMGENCMMWSVNKDTCFIRLALLKYTVDAPTDEKDSIETKVKILENQMRAIEMINFGNTIDKDCSGLQGGL